MRLQSVLLKHIAMHMNRTLEKTVFLFLSLKFRLQILFNSLVTFFPHVIVEQTNEICSMKTRCQKVTNKNTNQMCVRWSELTNHLEIFPLDNFALKSITSLTLWSAFSLTSLIFINDIFKNTYLDFLLTNTCGSKLSVDLSGINSLSLSRGLFDVL